MTPRELADRLDECKLIVEVHGIYGSFNEQCAVPTHLLTEAVAALRAAAVPDGRLRAVLEGLECEDIDNLMLQSPETLKAVGVEISKAAKLGAHLYAAARNG